MKRKLLLTLVAIAMIASIPSVTMTAQNSNIDTSKFVAFYNYSMNTQDENGQDVTDSLRLALQVGNQTTYCITLLAYNKDGRVSADMLSGFIMHHQNVLTDMGKGEVIAVEPIYPNRYETHEPLAQVDWQITEDTMIIGDLMCHRATGSLYGKLWHVWYTEEIPSSAGPWKLRGLPGLIVKADDAEGIHHFELYATKNEEKSIDFVSRPEYVKISRTKLLEFKRKTFTNPRYVNEPTYYVPENADETGWVNVNGVTYQVGINSHTIILQKAHVYQPLELE